jgi:hypothetical protein
MTAEKYGLGSRLADILRSPRAVEVVDRFVPGLTSRPEYRQWSGLPVRVFAERHYAAMDSLDQLTVLDEELASIEVVTEAAAEQTLLCPRPDYEAGDVPEGSAQVTVPEGGRAWEPVEIRLAGPSHGNPFTEVGLTARFTLNGAAWTVGGFYDGSGQWVARFLPGAPGTLRFTTSSTARSLNGVSGRVEIGPARGRGPVHADGFHFAHADGTRYLPLGTTAYAWSHQPTQVRQATLRTLAGGPFNKLRMCVFPKSFAYNADDPELFPFARDAEGAFDVSRFDPRFFRRVEEAVRDLDALGIQADVILFHPYDRWGFASLGQAADDHYLRYAVRRLQAFPNVWWSMANEYDFVAAKNEADWERLARILVAEDPAGHLRSIHNGPALYDHSREWITHASIQGLDRYKTTENVSQWRSQWKKPVIVDECGYEGDLPETWGNLGGRELVRRWWEAAVRGGYGGHGETYYRADQQIWWAKGGELAGEAPARIAFLGQVIRDAPGGVLNPARLPTDLPAAGIEGRFYLLYFGLSRPSFLDLPLPEGDYQVDVIDTWTMTIDGTRLTCGGVLHVDLPGREYMALRLTALTRGD